MKKKNLSILCAFLVCAIYAQAQSQKPAFGINAGVTFASYKVTISNISLASKNKTGFTAGLISSFSLGKSLSFQPAINFTQKGGVLTDNGSATKNTAVYNYLEIPLNIVFNAQGGNGDFFFGGGPSLSEGLGGKYKITGMYVENGDIKFGSKSDDDLKPFEAGINVLAGYQFKQGFLINAVYNLGLSNIAPDNESKFHNRYFAIKIGYMFKSVKK